MRLYMYFNEVSDTFDAISKLSSRTEITKLLAELFLKADPEEAKIISYCALGSLRPPYQSTQFQLASKSIAKVLADIFSTTPELITCRAHELGDLGLVAAEGTWTVKHPLTVHDVYMKLSDIEQTSGTGSQEEKAKKLRELLEAVSPQSAQTIVRIILSTLRLGFSDMTIIDAFSWMLVGNKSLHKEIENAYNLCADLGKIAYVLRSVGIEGLKDIGMVVGIPVRPAAAERLPTAGDIIEKIGTCAAQPKLDGFRLQIHLRNDEHGRKMWFFSRNLIDMSSMFPDLVQAFDRYTMESLIIEGEAIVYDERTGTFLPFQETVKRKRKHDIEELSITMPLRFFIFDILYYDGISQIDKTHVERRHVMAKLFPAEHSKTISVIDEYVVSTAEQLEDYFEKTMSSGLEGLVVKRLDSVYQPGKRNFNWIKLKRMEAGGLEDSIDAVILGYYLGSGKRALFGIGAFLVGVYNKAHDRFETLAKVGTGLTDEEWKDLKLRCDHKKVPAQLHNVICAKELIPDVWVHPEIVCSVIADEITQSPLHTAGKTEQVLGVALRFPRFVGYRIDKSAKEATTVDEIRRMLEDQRKRQQG